jgi:hypothetical protein
MVDGVDADKFLTFSGGRPVNSALCALWGVLLSPGCSRADCYMLATDSAVSKQSPRRFGAL